MALDELAKGLQGWEVIPVDAIPIQYPKPPYRLAVGAGAVANVVNEVIPNGMSALFSTIEATVDEPLGLPLMVWRFLLNETPLEETGDNFTLNHPLPAIIASDLRMYEGQRLRIQVTNPAPVPYTAVVRCRGWRWAERGDRMAAASRAQEYAPGASRELRR